MTDLAILYEHPQWFAPLFAALDRRGVDYRAIHADGLVVDPAATEPPARVVFNRIAMSSFLRAPEHPIFFAAAALAQWEALGARVLNGAAALTLDASKARQLSLIARLGLAIPATRIVHRTADLVAAARDLRFPIVVKANIGGSGAGIVRYEDPAALAAAVADGQVPDSIDRVLLVQEYAPARGGTITRIETLAGRFLYALEVDGGGSFDLCPADACALPGRPTITMKAVEPAPALIAGAEAIVAAAGIDVGGVEVLIDDRDGTPRFYDVNALSNFVADPLNVLGWDPHERLVDWLEQRIAEARA
jgi:hypothetical protein